MLNNSSSVRGGNQQPAAAPSNAYNKPPPSKVRRQVSLMGGADEGRTHDDHHHHHHVSVHDSERLFQNALQEGVNSPAAATIRAIGSSTTTRSSSSSTKLGSKKNSKAPNSSGSGSGGGSGISSSSREVRAVRHSESRFEDADEQLTSMRAYLASNSPNKQLQDNKNEGDEDDLSEGAVEERRAKSATSGLLENPQGRVSSSVGGGSSGSKTPQPHQKKPQQQHNRMLMLMGHPKKATSSAAPPVLPTAGKPSELLIDVDAETSRKGPLIEDYKRELVPLPSLYKKTGRLERAFVALHTEKRRGQLLAAHGGSATSLFVNTTAGRGADADDDVMLKGMDDGFARTQISPVDSWAVMKAKWKELSARFHPAKGAPVCVWAHALLRELDLCCDPAEVRRPNPLRISASLHISAAVLHAYALPPSIFEDLISGMFFGNTGATTAGQTSRPEQVFEDTLDLMERRFTFIELQWTQKIGEQLRQRAADTLEDVTRVSKQLRAAEDYNRIERLRTHFFAWRGTLRQAAWRSCAKRQAEHRFDSSLKRRCFDGWRVFVVLASLEGEVHRAHSSLSQLQKDSERDLRALRDEMSAKIHAIRSQQEKDSSFKMSAEEKEAALMADERIKALEVDVGNLHRNTRELEGNIKKARVEKEQHRETAHLATDALTKAVEMAVAGRRLGGIKAADLMMNSEALGSQAHIDGNRKKSVSRQQQESADDKSDGLAFRTTSSDTSDIVSLPLRVKPHFILLSWCNYIVEKQTGEHPKIRHIAAPFLDGLFYAHIAAFVFKGSSFVGDRMLKCNDISLRFEMFVNEVSQLCGENRDLAPAATNATQLWRTRSRGGSRMGSRNATPRGSLTPGQAALITPRGGSSGNLAGLSPPSGGGGGSGGGITPRGGGTTAVATVTVAAPVGAGPLVAAGVTPLDLIEGREEAHLVTQFLLLKAYFARFCVSHRGNSSAGLGGGALDSQQATPYDTPLSVPGAVAGGGFLHAGFGSPQTPGGASLGMSGAGGGGGGGGGVKAGGPITATAIEDTCVSLYLVQRSTASWRHVLHHLEDGLTSALYGLAKGDRAQSLLSGVAGDSRLSHFVLHPLLKRSRSTGRIKQTFSAIQYSSGDDDDENSQNGSDVSDDDLPSPSKNPKTEQQLASVMLVEIVHNDAQRKELCASITLSANRLAQLFAHYSERSSHMTLSSFKTMVFECGITNDDLGGKRTIEKLAHENAQWNRQAGMGPSEFVVALVELSEIVVPPLARAKFSPVAATAEQASRGGGNSLARQASTMGSTAAARFELFLTHFVFARVKISAETDGVRNLMLESDLAASLVHKHSAIDVLFTVVCSAGGGGGGGKKGNTKLGTSARTPQEQSLAGSADTATLQDFLAFWKDVGMSEGVTPAKELQHIFYFTQDEFDSSGRELMSIDEFRESLVAMALFRCPGPYMSSAGRFNLFWDDKLMPTLKRKYPSIHSKMVSGGASGGEMNE